MPSFQLEWPEVFYITISDNGKDVTEGKKKTKNSDSSKSVLKDI